ncbi:MAG TPA: HAMP domain-containing sensor histidine kinase [Nitrospiraceae bacterium]|nr:HAMP domain-containing sensor histidine kinase [Nitrospiraceae bacterium]
MPIPEAKDEAVRAIGNAMANLEQALVQLDRVPALDTSALGYVAHAMNNYVSVTEATVDLLEDALRVHADPEVAGWLEGIRHVGTLMHHLVSRLPRAAPVNTFPLKQDYMNLSVLMQRACDYHRRGATRKQLEIVCRTVGDMPLVWADRVAVAVIADNLLTNAVEVSPLGGKVQVQIMPGPGGAVCSIRDAGPGLNALEQSELFQRGDSAIGYGLTIAKDFIERMGGRLWYESTPGHGACFSFRLPYQP